ncbi:MAG: fluoride efflux transporter CrcB [Phycisphaera sp.]|nr:fluoride efflux transporter CrcB [Phycisphaera sp.]
MWKLLLIGIGGATGSLLRYSVSGWMQRIGERLGDGSFPLGTLTVNVVGCFLIAVLNVALIGPWMVREEYRIGLLVGVLGGFTTFSSFGWETLSLVNNGQWAYAVTNIVLNNLLGLAAALAGYRLAMVWFGTVS